MDDAHQKSPTLANTDKYGRGALCAGSQRCIFSSGTAARIPPLSQQHRLSDIPGPLSIDPSTITYMSASQRASEFCPSASLYGVMRMDFVAMVAHLNDPQATSEAEAMSPKSYLVWIAIVRLTCTRKIV